MAAPITPISPPRPIEPVQLRTPNPAGGGFPQMLQSAIQHVANSTAAANSAVENYLSGATQELHSTILATQSAELDFEMLLQVRNKVVSAYEEIMRMQI
jgi:flagellar hook-basal body complex protein FliE